MIESEPPVTGKSQSLSSDRPTRVRYFVLALVGSLAMITYLDRVCFGTAAPAIAKELGLDGIKDLKWAFTAFTLAYGLFEIPAGWLGDRWGPRGTLIRIVLGWSLFTALTGLSGLEIGGTVLIGFTGLVLVRFLFGAGEAGAYPNATRVVHDWFPAHRWERVQGVVWMSGRVAGGLTPLIWALLVAGTAWTDPLVTWRGAFFFFGGVGLVWCLIFAIFFRNRPDQHPSCNEAEIKLIGSRHAPHQAHPPVPWLALFRSRTLWALCLMYSLVNYGWIFNISYFPGYVDQRFEIPDQALWGAIYKGAPLWVGAIGCILGGLAVDAMAKVLGDRRRARRWIGVAAMTLCASCWFGARTTDNVHLFCLLVAMAGFGVDLTLGAAWASCQDLGGRHAGVTAACMNTVGTAGAAAASWMTGSIVQWAVEAEAIAAKVSVDALPKLSQQAAEQAGFQTVFLTYAIVYVIAASCWLLIDPSKSLDRDETSTE